MLMNDIEKKLSKKKIISTHVNFSNSWFKSLNWKHPIWKNHEVQFLSNQILNGEIKKINYTKR